MTVNSYGQDNSKKLLPVAKVIKYTWIDAGKLSLHRVIIAEYSWMLKINFIN